MQVEKSLMCRSTNAEMSQYRLEVLEKCGPVFKGEFNSIGNFDRPQRPPFDQKVFFFVFSSCICHPGLRTIGFC